ncbi:MAG TPA: hypothetical protein VMD59_04575, partial [Acidimicrobiales bacterium]|nr:hypothetical protein [Acidimicrobiales bacterium]
MTGDGGRNWKLHSTGAAVPGAVSFPTPSEGYVAASPIDSDEQDSAACGDDELSRPCTSILFTDDGGGRWRRVAPLLPPVFGIDFTSLNAGLAAVDTCAASWPPAKPPPDVFENSLPPP